MPLPSDTNQAWPPPQLAPVYAKINEWNAWYTGDPERLVKVYDRSNRPANRPSQYRGGLVGKAARIFWGEPTPDGELRTKLHIPLAADIAQTSARLLFSEPPTLTASNKETQKRLDELVDDGAHATMLAAAEVASAKGGTYLRIVWDRSLRPRPWIARVDPRSAVPEFQFGVLRSLTIWKVLEDTGSKVIRWLERHESGVILHGVYEGTEEKLGRQVDVGGWPETSWLKTMQGVKWEGLVAAVETVPDRLTAVHIPNVTPSRIWADLPGAAPNLGRSDYDGVEGMLDALDETWTSLMRDLRLGVARLYVPNEYLRSLGNGNGAVFDAAREIIVGLQTMADDTSGLNMELFQPDIRVEQHLTLGEALTRNIVETAGYSAQSFGMGDSVAATATEVVARNRDSFIGRDAKLVHMRPGLAEIYETLLMVDSTVFGVNVTPEMPQIVFGDSVSEDPEAQARTLQLLEAARAISTYMKVKTLHSDWEEKDILDEVDRIKSDAGSGADPMAMLDGLAGNDPSGVDQAQADQQQVPAGV